MPSGHFSWKTNQSKQNPNKQKNKKTHKQTKKNITSDSLSFFI